MAKKPAKPSRGEPAPKRGAARAKAPAPEASDTPGAARDTTRAHPAPVALAEILGQERAVKALTDAILSRRVHHAWIFHGPPGVGKFTTALAFAALVLDPTTQATLSGEVAADPRGPTRRRLDAGAHPDLHVITKELARFSESRSVREQKLITIPKDVIDEHLIGPAGLAPTIRSDSPAGKVFIVDEAELLDRSATNAPTQNALLKTIEEPAERTVIILVTSAEDLLLPTIRSRCQRVAFSPLGEAAMRAWLAREKPGVTGEAREWLSSFAAGSPGVFRLALEGGVHAWHGRLSGPLARAMRGEYSLEFGPAMAACAEEWAEAWVKSHANASKEAANKAGADWVFRVLAHELRPALRASRGEGAMRAAEAMDAIHEAERRLDANVNGQFVFEALSAELAGVFAGEAGVAR